MYGGVGVVIKLSARKYERGKSCNSIFVLKYQIDTLEFSKCKNRIAKCKNCTLDCTLEENAVLAEIKIDSKITQKQIAEKIGKSERTVKTIMNSLEEKGIISREGGKRFGYWKVNV